MVTYAIEVTEFNSEVRCDLPGCLEAAMASEVTKMAVRGNMHMDTRVAEVTESNSEVRRDIKAVWRPPWPQRQSQWLLEAICTWIPG